MAVVISQPELVRLRDLLIDDLRGLPAFAAVYSSLYYHAAYPNRIFPICLTFNSIGCQ